jgi:PBP1b-binding outer membrane lipoprotein LpoB
MDNPEKREAYCTQDEDKQNKNITQYVLDTTMRKQIQITKIKPEPSYKQLEVKTNQNQDRSLYTILLVKSINMKDNVYIFL